MPTILEEAREVFDAQNVSFNLDANEADVFQDTISEKMLPYLVAMADDNEGVIIQQDVDFFYGYCQYLFNLKSKEKVKNVKELEACLKYGVKLLFNIFQSDVSGEVEVDPAAQKPALEAFKNLLNRTTVILIFLENPEYLSSLFVSEQDEKFELFLEAINYGWIEKIFSRENLEPSLNSLADALIKMDDENLENKILEKLKCNSGDYAHISEILLEGFKRGLIQKRKEDVEKRAIECVQDHLNDFFPEHMAGFCEDLFDDTDVIEKKGPFFKAVLDLKDSSSVEDNLKKVVEALMCSESKNFWNSVSDVNHEALFSLDYRVILIESILEYLYELDKSKLDISETIKQRAINFISEQWRAIKETEKKEAKQYNLVFPVLFKATNFKVLSELYDYHNTMIKDSDVAEDIKNKLTPIFTDCYTPVLHDELYKVGLSKNWEFLTKVVMGEEWNEPVILTEQREDATESDAEEESLCDSHALTPLESKKEALKSRKVEDYAESQFQNDLKAGRGFMARWNLMDNLYPDSKGFSNFFSALGIYWGLIDRPQPVYETLEAVIKITNDLEEETDTEPDDATHISNDTYTDVRQSLLLDFSSMSDDLIAYSNPHDRKKFLNGCIKEKRLGGIEVDSNRLVTLYQEIISLGKLENEKEFVSLLTKSQIKGIYKKLLQEINKDGKNSETDIKNNFCQFIANLDLEQLQELYSQRKRGEDDDLLPRIREFFVDEVKKKSIFTSLYKSYSEQKGVQKEMLKELKNACGDENLARELVGLPPISNVFQDLLDATEGDTLERGSTIGCFG